MRNGHYTKSDIIDLRIIERDKKKNIAREAIAILDDFCIRSYGLKEVYINQTKGTEQEKRYSLENVPAKFAVIAALVEKKAVGHGGKRFGSGQKKSGREVRKTRSFRLTEKEFAAVCKFINEMRNNENEIKEEKSLHFSKCEILRKELNEIAEKDDIDKVKIILDIAKASGSIDTKEAAEKFEKSIL